MNEKELVIKAKKGDINAFCLLYDMYKKKLYNYAYYKLGNSADAEDVVQDCVLTAFEQIHKLKNPEAFPLGYSEYCIAVVRQISKLKFQTKAMLTSVTMRIPFLMTITSNLNEKN